MPSVQESLQQVYSSSPPSYNFSIANRNLHRFRMCRLHRLGSSISPLAGWKLFCSGTLEHDCSATGLRANPPEQHLAAHLDWNKLHIEITPSCSCKISGSAAFIFVCLFIHVFIRGRYFRVYEKPIPSRTENSLKRCWQAPRHFLHPTKAPQAFLTIALFPPVPLQSNDWKLHLCVDSLLLVFFEYIACMCFSLY